MPASGRGANLDTSRRITGVRRPAPSAAPHPPAPSVNLRLPLPTQPFRPAQQQAQKRVVQTQRALPKQPTPNIPRLPHPTPAQTTAAINLIKQRAHEAVGPNASARQIADYHRELANDPRQHEYLRTIAHYTTAAQSHAAELAGRIQAGGGHSIESALTPAAMQLSRADAEAAGRKLLAQVHATAGKGPKPSGFDTLPGVAEARNYLGERAAEDIPALGRAGSAIATLLTGSVHQKGGGLVSNALSDVADIGRFPLVAGLQVGKALVDTAGGNSHAVQDLVAKTAKGFTQGAVGEAVQGNFSAAEQALKEHPVISATEVAGGLSAVGRAGGIAARTAGAAAPDSALARIGGQVRSPVAYTDEAGLAKRGSVSQRTSSPDLIRKYAQHLADRTRKPLLDAEGKPVQITERGKTVTVLKARGPREERHLANKRGNFEAARQQAGEHLERERVRKAANAAEAPAGRLPGTGKVGGAIGKELTHLVATGTIRSVETFKADLEKRAKEVEAAVQNPDNFRTRADLKAAQRNASMLRKAADSPKIAQHVPAIVEQGLNYGRALNAADVRSAGLGIHPHEEVARSALHEYAIAHMGARHFTVEDHHVAEQHALAAEHSAAQLVADGHLGSPEHAAAVAQLRAARSHRIAVSGRGLPERVIAHEEAFHAHTAARGALSEATTELRRAERARARLVGVHASRRGSQGLRGSTEKEKALSAQSLDRIKSAKAAVTQAARDRRAAAETLRRTRLPKVQEAIRKVDGQILTNAEIHAHATAAGRDPATIAYAPHVIGAGSKRSYHQPYRPGTRPTAAGSEAKTGSLYHSGATLFSTQLLRDELTRKGTLAHKAEALDKFANEAGLRRPNGDYFTAKAGVEAASRFKAEGKGEYVPIRAFGAKLSPETQAQLREVQKPALMETAHLGLLKDRIVTAGQSGAQNVVLVPKPLIDALEAQLQPAGSLEKSVQLLNAPFRMAVLPQPRWLTGNFIEPFVIRLPLAGSGINLPGAALDLRAGHKLLKAMEASGDAAQIRAAREIRDQQFGGLFIGRRGASQRRTYEDFPGTEGEVLYGMHVARNLPATKQLGDLVLALPHGFFAINRVIESTAQRMAFGKMARKEIQQFTGQWHQTVTLGQQALSDVGKGLVNTSAQQRFMEAQHELLGKYDGFGPRTRKLIQTVAPFLPWTLASMRFVFWTVPAHHTVAFTAMMKLAQSVSQEWEAEHAGVPPGTLKDAIVRKDKGLVDLERYTPYGATSPVVQGDATNLTDTLLPQLSGATKALQGQDPFGRELKVPKTATNEGKASGAQKAGIAANSLLEALVPLLAQGRRLREGGGTAYANSTIISPKVKPGTSHMSALERTFSPIRPTYLKAPAFSAGSGGGQSAAGSAATQRALEKASSPSPRQQAAIQRALERAAR